MYNIFMFINGIIYIYCSNLIISDGFFSGSFIRLQPPPTAQQNQKGQLPPPDITHHIASELNKRANAGSVRIQPPQNSNVVGTLYCKGKVSTKIQQLLNTLKVGGFLTRSTCRGVAITEHSD